MLSGTILGVAWSLFGVYLGSLVIDENPPAAYAIRGVFLAIVALIHGFLRSRTPRLFLFVLLMMIVSVVTLTSTAKDVTPLAATQILYPILLAAGCIILINLVLFPEFSSRFLGQMTIDTLNETAKALENAGQYFVEARDPVTQAERIKSKNSGESQIAEIGPTDVRQNKISRTFHSFFFGKITDNNDTTKVTQASLAELTSSKAKIRKKLGDCKSAQQECNFEVAFSVLPPRDIKLISVTAMKRLVANTIAVISACESRFALLGSDEEADKASQRWETTHVTEQDQNGNDSEDCNQSEESTGHFGTSELLDDDFRRSKVSTVIDQDKAELDMIKPKREIEFGDARLLRNLLKRAAKPYTDLHHVSTQMIEVVNACVAFAFVGPIFYPPFGLCLKLNLCRMCPHYRPVHGFPKV